MRTRSLGTLPVPPRSSSRFPNEALEDSERDSRQLKDQQAFNSKLEADQVFLQQGLRESNGDWDFPFIKVREHVENEAEAAQENGQRVNSKEFAKVVGVEDVKPIEVPQVGTARSAYDDLDAKFLVRERHILRGQHF